MEAMEQDVWAERPASQYGRLLWRPLPCLADEERGMEYSGHGLYLDASLLATLHSEVWAKHPNDDAFSFPGHGSYMGRQIEIPRPKLLSQKIEVRESGSGRWLAGMTLAQVGGKVRVDLAGGGAYTAVKEGGARYVVRLHDRSGGTVAQLEQGDNRFADGLLPSRQECYRVMEGWRWYVDTSRLRPEGPHPALVSMLLFYIARKRGI
jgi:hypothetical protein